MKKIMKKALSLMLVLALVLVPMTVMAGSGAEADPIVLENSTSVITSNGTGESVYYLYNAPVAADYVITVTGAIDSFGYSMIHPMTGMPMKNYAYNGELVMYANQTDEVAFSMFDETSQELTVTITMTEGTEVGGGNVGGATGATPDDAIELTESSAFLTIAGGGTTVYYKVAVEEEAAYTLELYSRVGAGFDIYLLNPRFGQYGYYGSSDNGLLTVEFTATSTDYIFGVGNPEDMELNVQATLTKAGGSEEEGSNNSFDNPEVITEMDTYNSTMPADAFSYWYQWTAAEAGVLTVTTTNVDGYAGFTVNGDWECVTESLDNGGKVMVDAGDVVVFYVSPAGASTVNMTASFEAGAVIEQNQGGMGEEETNYEMGAALEIGTNEYVASLYPYTVYTFDPTEVGEYTISSTDSVLGIVSYNGMWITIEPSAETVSESSLVWECTSVGQSIWVAAMPNTNIATITVTKDELDDSDEVPWIDYENIKAPTAFEYKNDASKLQFVDIEDGVQNTAVLGEDGYYHLDKADGPILFVNLNDQLMSLVSMVGYGKVAAIYYENNEVVEKVDYTAALLKYIENADVVDAQTTLYPLTADLIEMFQEVGASNDWYDANNEFAVGSEADAWMFACYYDEAITSLAPSTGGTTGGTTGGATTDGTTSNNNSSSSTVTTGDNTNAFVWVAVMMIGLAAVAVVLKKRAR